MWAVYRCTSCGGVVLAKGKDDDKAGNAEVVQLFPTSKQVADELPPVARRFLEQAYQTLHAPDAAPVMAASAVDAMLKDRGYTDGSLYERIDAAVRDHLLTEEMGRWAHHVRLESNRPRHADSEDPHVTSEEAAQVVEFADALSQFLYVLSARIKKGLKESAGNS
jgi:Domain of unknown function (DUF4145)